MIEDGNFNELKTAMIQEQRPRLYFDDLTNGEVVKGLQSEHEEGAYQPSPLEFNIGDIEGFRTGWKTQNVPSLVWRKGCPCTGAETEMLNSTRLKDHFKKTPRSPNSTTR